MSRETSATAVPRGVAWSKRLAAPESSPPHIVTTAIEHHAVLHTARALERQGFAATYVAPHVLIVASPCSVVSSRPSGSYTWTRSRPKSET